MQICVWAPKTAGRSLVLKKRIRFWSYAHRCLVNFGYFFLCVDFHGIDEIVRGFTSQVGYRKLLNFMVMLGVLQMVPPRASWFPQGPGSQVRAFGPGYQGRVPGRAPRSGPWSRPQGRALGPVRALSRYAYAYSAAAKSGDELPLVIWQSFAQVL